MDYTKDFLELSNGEIKLLTISHRYKEDIFKEFNLSIAGYIYPKVPDKIEDTEEFIDYSIKTMKVGSNLQLVILKNSSLEFLGCVGLHNITTKTPELGLWLKKSAWGYSYGINSIKLLVEWARINIEYDYFKYPVDKRNMASVRIAKSFGANIGEEFDCVGANGNPLYINVYHFR